ncbi:MAG: SPOR domain-containing protein [Pseudomonadota bacterium]
MMPTIAEDDAAKLRAFEQRMQQEGAAGFAAGPAPWDHWDDLVSLGTYRVWMNSLRRTAPAAAPAAKPLTTRLLTGVAQLALLALLIGSAGVYVSILNPQPPLAAGGVQPPPIMVAERTPPRPLTSAQPVRRSHAGSAGADLPAPPGETAPAAADVLQTAAETVAPTPVPAAPDPADGTASATAQTLASTLDALPGTAAGPAPTDPAAATQAAVVATTADAAEPAATPAEAAPEPASRNRDEPPADNHAGAGSETELTGTWVVNLASYNYESMAQRKLEQFHDKGVNAELARIMVKGKSIIRLRTTGYKSKREAIEWVPLLEERLGLDGAWVAKYEPGKD